MWTKTQQNLWVKSILKLTAKENHRYCNDSTVFETCRVILHSRNCNAARVHMAHRYYALFYPCKNNVSEVGINYPDVSRQKQYFSVIIQGRHDLANHCMKCFKSGLQPEPKLGITKNIHDLQKLSRNYFRSKPRNK